MKCAVLEALMSVVETDKGVNYYTYSEHVKEVWIQEMTSELDLEGCGECHQAEQRGRLFIWRNDWNLR